MLDNPEVTSTRPPARPPDPLFRRSLAVAAAIGALYAILVHGVAPGFGWSLFLISAVGSVIWLGRESMDYQGRALLAGAALVAALSAVRSLPSLAALNLLAFSALLIMAVGVNRRPGLHHWRISDLLTESIETGFGVFSSPLAYLRTGIATTERSFGRLMRRLGPITVGLGISVLALIIFGSLLASADAVFESFGESLIRSLENLPSVSGRLVGSVLAGWMTLGIVARVRRPPATPASGNGSPRLQAPVVLLPLISLDVLFGAFVLVQFAYLFGGADTVARTGLSHAEYARRGFFELVVVAALVVAVILIAEWATRALPNRRGTLAASQVLLVLTIVTGIAAVRRMLLYVGEFGLTELRVYTTTFLFWVGFILIWMSLTVLRGRGDRLVVGAVTSAFILTVGLNLAHPASMISAANLDRAAEGKELDIHYLISLGSGAVPTLQSRVNEIQSQADRDLARDALADFDLGSDWRELTIDRWAAKRR